MERSIQMKKNFIGKGKTYKINSLYLILIFLYFLVLAYIFFFLKNETA